MPFVPSAEETRRLRRAIDAAAFTEGERIFWLLAFAGLMALVAAILVTAATIFGAVGFLGGVFVLYWRLRAPHMARHVPEADRHLFALGLMRRDQRAFTALMLRHAFTGNNPLRRRREHDPLGTWQGRVAG